MTRQLLYSVVGDGGTDRALLPILRWAIHRHDPGVDLLEPDFVKRQGSLSDFLRDLDSAAMLVFVHRDAETESLASRLTEFEGVLRKDVVPVVPVRMTEAWLLIDAAAISRAADQPQATISIPRLQDLESLSNPKETLEELLLLAAGSPTGRRRKKFLSSLTARRVNVAELITDYAPLEQLPAFQHFQQTLAERYPYGPG